jgi:hypothetical protein
MASIGSDLPFPRRALRLGCVYAFASVRRTRRLSATVPVGIDRGPVGCCHRCCHHLGCSCDGNSFPMITRCDS